MIENPCTDPDFVELTRAVERVRETYGQPIEGIVARIRDRHPGSIAEEPAKSVPDTL